MMCLCACVCVCVCVRVCVFVCVCAWVARGTSACSFGRVSCSSLLCSSSPAGRALRSQGLVRCLFRFADGAACLPCREVRVNAIAGGSEEILMDLAMRQAKL